MALNYEKSYVAFLDVLGFKKLVNSKQTLDVEKIELYLETARKAIDGLKKIPSKINIGSILISDSIILTVPFGANNNENVNNLRQLCIAVLYIQRKLSEHDIWIRGGISCGDTYFDKENNQIIGSAYINAYLLEEKMAIYPRVILDTKIIRELECLNSSCLITKINKHNENEVDYLGGIVLYDWNNSSNLDIVLEKDTPLFIDYMPRNKDQIHKIINSLEVNTSENIELYSKFKWLSRYLMTITNDRDLIERLHAI